MIGGDGGGDGDNDGSGGTTAGCSETVDVVGGGETKMFGVDCEVDVDGCGYDDDDDEGKNGSCFIRSDDDSGDDVDDDDADITGPLLRS